MIGDRVKIVSQEYDTIPVYMPRKEVVGGEFMRNHDGTVIVQMAGGVKAGAIGTIQDVGITVNRASLRTGDNRLPGLGGTDNVILYPVLFDDYQQVGWVPSDNIKIGFGGQA